MLSLFKKDSQKKLLASFIKKNFGIKPGNIALYEQAFLHKSALRDERDAHIKSNERLEFLGDAVLDCVVAAYLFDRFPNKDEGYITQLKSRIVNRENLNELGKKLHLQEFTRFFQFGASSPKALYGNVMEAIIGAIYLDKGFDKTQKCIHEYILRKHVNMDMLAEKDLDYKSQLLIWSQKKKRTLEFKVVSEKQFKSEKQFVIHVMLDGEKISEFTSSSKREAEKQASKIALKHLDII